MKNAKIVALAFCILFAGCVTSVVTDEVEREYRDRYNYGERFGILWLNLLNDVFLDGGTIPQMGLTFGPSWPLFDVHATKAIQLGFGWFEGTSVGLRERAFGVWEESSQQYGIGPFYWLDLKREAAGGLFNDVAFKHDYEYTGWNLLESPRWKEGEADWFDIGGAAHLFFVGAWANWSPTEALDAGLSVVFLPVNAVLVLCNYNYPVFDIMGDDRWNMVRKELEAEGLGQ